MNRLRRMFRWLFASKLRPFWSGRITTTEPGPLSYCPTHQVSYRGECLRCEDRVCVRPGCGLPKDPDQRTCGREKCEEWDRQQHRALRAVG